ncbi:MAG: CpXC domain-containing protein [Anaerolineae bacterium]|nr:CpXC domain-containing protein [Anaerolineae bacterium]
MARQMMIRCANCGVQFPAVVESIVDAGRDPEAKLRLLGGALNAVQCSNCGYQMAIGAPVLYHDASKELLIGFVPPELNLSNDQQEKALGDLMRELTNQIPKEQFKGYLFQPRRALTLQGLIEQVLGADGVTPEMIETQKARARLIERLMETPEHALQQVIAENDALIDGAFFQTMNLMAQRLAGSGAVDAAEQILMVQARIAEESSYGRQAMAQAQAEEALVQEVADEVETLGEDADRPEFLGLARRYQDDESRLRALVGLARPVFDYTFFQDMTAEIGRAPAAERDRLERLREKLLTLAQEVDQQTQAAVRAAAQLLQQIINAPDIDEAIQRVGPLIDSTFLSVLDANLQQAQRNGDQALLQRLSYVYQHVNAMIEQTMPPALRFINDLLATETDEDASALLDAHAQDYADDLLPTIDAVEGVLAQRGESDLLRKLVFLRALAERILL